ncbi:MAG: hypothetical protein DRN71_03195 [Candidatus Nanohalarchaeota archaeon]|nr:MAG: hypothetical protein DRN71_03195 [Candidatus Nanohaloarchaeota archaeon]
MNTVAQLNEAHRDIDSHSAYSEAQEDFSNRNQYIENISNLEEYADSRVRGYRSIWRNQSEIERNGESKVPEQKKIPPLYEFLTTVFGNGKEETFTDGITSYEFKDNRLNAITRMNRFEIESKDLIDSLRDHNKPFCEYIGLFEELVRDIKSIRKGLKQRYVNTYREVAEGCVEDNSELRQKELRTERIDINMEKYFLQWKKFEDESLKGIYDLVTEINKTLDLGPCDPFGNPDDSEAHERMFG